MVLEEVLSQLDTHKEWMLYGIPDLVEMKGTTYDVYFHTVEGFPQDSYSYPGVSMVPVFPENAPGSALATWRERLPYGEQITRFAVNTKKPVAAYHIGPKKNEPSGILDATLQFFDMHEEGHMHPVTNVVIASETDFQEIFGQKWQGVYTGLVAHRTAINHSNLPTSRMTR